MHNSRIFVIALGLIVSSQVVLAQDLSRYRDYVLGTSVESVVAASASRAADVKTLHARPAKIEELEWRSPYTSSHDELVDPVRGAVFSFVDDALYQIVVSYDRTRVEGLTNSDIIDALSAVYGKPMLRSARNRPLYAPLESVVLAQWDSAGSSLILFRGVYSNEFQLMLNAKALSGRARTAISEARRMDSIEAPRRASEQRKKEAAAAGVARDKNKAAFRP
jgi:hypothetical protein